MTDTVYRITYQLLGRLRFLSHKELMRVMARAFRRARLPLAYSQGFHPHPRLSFGPPRSTGMRGTAEQLDAQFTEPCTPSDVVAALRSRMPDDLRIVDAAGISPRSPSITASTRAASYTCEWPSEAALPDEAIDRLLAHATVACTRTSGGGVREVNLRPGIHAIQWTPPHMAMHLALRQDLHVRPQEVIAALTGWPDDTIRRIMVTRTGFDAAPNAPGFTTESHGP